MSGLLTINSCCRGSSRAGSQAQEGSAWQELQGNSSSGKAQTSRDSSCTGAATVHGGTPGAPCPGHGVTAPTWQIQHIQDLFQNGPGNAQHSLHSQDVPDLLPTCLLSACNFPRRNMEALHTLYNTGSHLNASLLGSVLHLHNSWFFSLALHFTP